MEKKSALEAKVIAVNRANAEANRLHALFLVALAPFVNKKVITVEGNLIHKVAEIVRAIPTTAHQTYRHYQRGSFFAWSVKECEGYGDHTCVYAEARFYIGVIDGQILRDVANFEPPNLKTDYTPEMIRDARQRVIKARSELSSAQGALGEFGEYDR